MGEGQDETPKQNVPESGKADGKKAQPPFSRALESKAEELGRKYGVSNEAASDSGGSEPASSTAGLSGDSTEGPGKPLFDSRVDSLNKKYGVKDDGVADEGGTQEREDVELSVQKKLLSRKREERIKTEGEPQEPAPSGRIEPEGGGGSPIKKIVSLLFLLAIIALIAGAAAIAYHKFAGNAQISYMYQCWDGSFAEQVASCPVQPTTTTTTIETTTSTSTTTSSTTTLKGNVECYTNVDCEKPQTTRTYCEDNVVKIPYITYSCLHPGTELSKCLARTGEPKPVKSCMGGEYCLDGECYPLTCQDHKRNYNETKIDCGGRCKPCTKNDVMCATESDCGIDQRISGYYCLNGNPAAEFMQYTCMLKGARDSSCLIENKTVVVEYCQRWQMCVEGQGGCYYRGGNCQDCIQDQGESGIDCGGPCQPCATRPPVYEMIEVKRGERPTYRGYSIEFNNVIRLTGNCTNGVSLFIRSPDDVPKSVEVTRTSNSEAYGLQVGFVNGTTRDAIVWVSK